VEFMLIHTGKYRTLDLRP